MGFGVKETVTMYFNLHRPESELLLGGNESYRNREYYQCPITTEHLDGSRRVGSLAVKLEHNHRDELMIWCRVEGLAIHERLLAEFEQQGFTGYRTKPATVTFRDGSASSDYREFVVTGWAGIAQPDSGISVKISCPACHWKTYTGVKNYEKLIDWNQWTGEDFFIVWPLPRFVLVTERVAMWLLGREVKSFCLRGLDDPDQSVGTSGFTVGRLSNFLPEDLAITYGRPLGLE